ncbi:MAG: ABC transporter permease [Planctomycetota bacterium]
MITRLELALLWRSRRPHLVAASLAVLLAAMLLGFFTGGESRAGLGGLFLAFASSHFGLVLVLPVFAAVEGSAQIAGEASSGTLLLLLTRPLGRRRLFLTKLAVAAGFVSLAAGALLAAAVVLGLALGGGGDLDLPPGVLAIVESPQHLGRGAAVARFVLTWPATSLALLAPLSLGFLVAAWIRRPLPAAATAVAIYVVGFALAEARPFADLRPWLFTSHMAYWGALFRADIPWRELALEAAVLLANAVLFAALAFRRFRLREER